MVQKIPVAMVLATVAVCVLTFSGEAAAQETYRDAIHLPNGTRYTSAFSVTSEHRAVSAKLL
jgi:hypothetical protein